MPVESLSDRSAWLSFLLKTLIFIGIIFMLDFGLSKVLDEGIRRYFGMNGPVDVLCIGHSRTMLGIDAELLSKTLGMKVAKYAVNGANTADRNVMVRHFLSEHPEVRILIYDVESTSFSDEGLSSNSYRLFFPFIENPEISAYLRSQSTSSTEYYLRKVIKTSRYDEVTAALAVRGFMGFEKNLKFGSFDAEKATRWLEQGRNRPVKIVESNLKVFMETMEYAKSRGVKVLLVDMPAVDVLNQVEQPLSDPVRSIFRALPGKYPNVAYLDLSRAYEKRHEIFYDMIHMNADGQKIVKEAIGTRTRTMLR